MMKLKCVVACTNAEGAPDLFFVIVECTQDQYDKGDHYEAAKAHALKEAYEAPFVVFDENDDAGQRLLELFEWRSATEVKI